MRCQLHRVEDVGFPSTYKSSPTFKSRSARPFLWQLAAYWRRLTHNDRHNALKNHKKARENTSYAKLQ